MLPRLLPVRFPSSDAEFDTQLERLRVLLGDVATFLDPVELGADAPPSEAAIFPQMLGDAFREVEALRALDRPRLVITSEFGTMAMWDWEILRYLEGMDKLAKYTFATHIKDLKINPHAAPDDWYFFSSAAVGDGLVDNLSLARKLKEVGYTGFLAAETDFLHPDYDDDEHAAARTSIAALKKIAASLG